MTSLFFFRFFFAFFTRISSLIYLVNVFGIRKRWCIQLLDWSFFGVGQAAQFFFFFWLIDWLIWHLAMFLIRSVKNNSSFYLFYLFVFYLFGLISPKTLNQNFCKKDNAKLVLKAAFPPGTLSAKNSNQNIVKGPKKNFFFSSKKKKGKK